MMVAQHEEILCTTTLVAFNQCLRVPLLSLEKWQDVFIAKLRGVAVVLTVVVILSTSLEIQSASHPVA